MKPKAWRAVGLLPVNVLVVIPALLLWLTRKGRWAWAGPDPREPALWLALACFAGGLALMVQTIRNFDRLGEGTLAPWDPTRKLVVVGVYRHVRNPMISGVVLNLLGESLLFRSPALGLWCAFFFLGNALYMPLVEEPGLERRFGEDYRRYKRAVPRWVPRRRPYEGGR
ncbi:MAG: isoprenylcysteine carboxylmethyltransferase family protein [Myxococcota bacterium]|nr:isoprenylcysteine carboxylmethyltransferase family protein [Myxococcota bacterium]